MKKLFLALLFSAVLFIGLPSNNVSAMSVTYDIPFSYVPDVSDLFLGMLSGGQYDLSNASTLEEAIEQHKESLKQGYHFLQRFAINLWNWQVTQAGLGNTTLNEDSDLAIYVSPSDIAAFMGYNLRWWEREQTNIESIVVSPDPNFLSYLDVINGTGFNPYKNLSNGISGVSSNWLKYGQSWEDISIFGQTYNGLNSSGRSDYIYAAPITTLYITKNLDNTYYCYVTFDQIDMFLGTSSSRGYFNQAGSYSSSWGQYFSKESSSNTATWAHTFTGTLQQIFNSLQTCCRNVNIYVDGVCWSYVGDIPSDYISAPDVIQVGDTGIESYDVFIPDIPGYDGLSINGFLEWLNTRLGDKDVGLDDLIEDAPDIVIGVDENNEPTTRPITYDDVKPAPIVIDTDITADPDPDNPTPTPTPDPTTFPLPPFPKFPIPSDIPNANIQHTVLAEIIDATQSVVPQDLMVLIWATFSLLIIGGIIYILHK